MRIAFFCPHSDPLAATGEPDAGGQCVYEAQVAMHLARLGHEVRLFTRRWNDKPASQTMGENTTVFRYAMGAEGFLRKEDMGPHLPEFAARVMAEQGDWLAQADVLHGHYWDGGVAASIVGLALSKPLVFTSHSLGCLKLDRVPDTSVDGSLYRYPQRIQAETRVLQIADGVIALSQSEKSALLDRYGVAADKITVIPGGVALDDYQACADKKMAQRELGFNSDFLLFTVGRLDRRKGFLELLDAIPGVVKHLEAAGKTATLLLPSGPEQSSAEERGYRQALRDKAEQLGIMSWIHWFPRLSDQELRRYYSAADLFLCPSPYEPFGLVLVEAFASGTPVVATPNGGPAEIVTPGLNGYLANPLDPDAFARRIVDVLCTSTEQRGKMNAAALNAARTRYGWAAVADAIAQSYQTLA